MKLKEIVVSCETGLEDALSKLQKDQIIVCSDGFVPWEDIGFKVLDRKKPVIFRWYNGAIQPGNFGKWRSNVGAPTA